MDGILGWGRGELGLSDVMGGRGGVNPEREATARFDGRGPNRRSRGLILSPYVSVT